MSCLIYLSNRWKMKSMVAAKRKICDDGDSSSVSEKQPRRERAPNSHNVNCEICGKCSADSSIGQLSFKRFPTLKNQLSWYVYDLSAVFYNVCITCHLPAIPIFPGTTKMTTCFFSEVSHSFTSTVSKG